MTIRFQCPGCAKLYAVEDGLAGRQVRCNDCKAAFQIPAPDATTSPPGTSSSFDELFNNAVSQPSTRLGASASPRGQKGGDLASLAGALGRRGTLWIVGILVMVGMAALYPPLVLLLLTIGGVAGLIGFVWLILMAARVDHFTSLEMRFLIPWAWIGFIRGHWPDTRTPARLLLVGLLTIPCDIFIAPLILSRMGPPRPQAGGVAPHADEPEVFSSPAADSERPGHRVSPPARTRPRPADDSRGSREDEQRAAPVSGYAEFMMKAYEGDGDAVEVARRALQDVPWVVLETITVDRAGGAIRFDVRGQTRYINMDKVRILLTRAGFRLGGCLSAPYDKPGDSPKS